MIIIQLSLWVLCWATACRAFAQNDHGVGFCEEDMDAIGAWWDTQPIRAFVNSQAYYQQRVYHGYGDKQQNPYLALTFSRVFIPGDCWMFRLNHAGVLQAATDTKKITGKPVHLLLLGDSATRGVFCGLARIMAGSETLGPNDNEVCGRRADTARVGPQQALRHYSLTYGGGAFTLHFGYVMSLGAKREVQTLVETIAKTVPLTHVVLNTGAYDFDSVSRKFEFPGPYPFEHSTSVCYNDEYKAVGAARDNAEAKSELEGIAAAVPTARMLWRSNHHNARFGVRCADDALLKSIKHDEKLSSRWSVWDNRGLSHEHWRDQTSDGFHFDRDWLHASLQHQQYLDIAPGATGPPEMQHLKATDSMHYTRHVGELEQALVQSLLHRVFHPALAAHAAIGAHQASGPPRWLAQWAEPRIKEGELVMESSGNSGANPKSIFLYHQNSLHEFPSWDTYLNMGFKPNSKISDMMPDEFLLIPMGKPLPVQTTKDVPPVPDAVEAHGPPAITKGRRLRGE
jgi:hypothetical protein